MVKTNKDLMKLCMPSCSLTDDEVDDLVKALAISQCPLQVGGPYLCICL